MLHPLCFSLKNVVYFIMLPFLVPVLLCAMLLHSIAHSIICTRLFCGKMHSDWFSGIEILQGRWQRGEKVGYCYPCGIGRTLCKWEIYVPRVTKRLRVKVKQILLQAWTGLEGSTRLTLPNFKTIST
jgi:hypothetical protein